MIYGFESDTKIDDEILKKELGANGDVKLKNIVRTIQKEQNTIIRNTKDKIMVIQGAAGSGKTSVALHRIAYLLYHERDRLKASDVLILSPNSVFSDYISHILPELGEENIQEMSFDIFAYRELKDIVSDCEDRYDYLERLIKTQDEEYKQHFQEKQSFGFIGQMESFLAVLEEELIRDYSELEKLKHTVDVAIDGMEDPIEELVLRYRYSKLMKIDDIAAEMQYSVRWIKRVHARALEHFERSHPSSP